MIWKCCTKGSLKKTLFWMIITLFLCMELCMCTLTEARRKWMWIVQRRWSVCLSGCMKAPCLISSLISTFSNIMSKLSCSKYGWPMSGKGSIIRKDKNWSGIIFWSNRLSLNIWWRWTNWCSRFNRRKSSSPPSLIRTMIWTNSEENRKHKGTSVLRNMDRWSTD